MNSINFKHSIIFFNLCILISPFYQILNYEPIIPCLFTILIIGISHGSLDNIKGKKLLKLFGYKSGILFYSIYLIISLSIIILWLILPNTILLLFLIVAAFHFGKEDTVFAFKRRFFIPEILFFFKGSSVIIAPLLFQRDATNMIFKTLNFYVFESSIFNDQFLMIILFLSFLSSIYISSNKDSDNKALMIMDFLSLIILNFFLTPVLAFTLYFCFLHSIRHSITLIFELDKFFNAGLKKFISKAFPLTLITSIVFLITIYFLNNFYKLDEAIYKVVFIGLASLTFPHILLEYLLEKNEKRA
jgi:beta-carotene 15,15'-dioxygenase